MRQEISELKDSIHRERESSLVTQKALEQSLKTRIDNLSDALSVKVHQESEARLDRALEVVQRQCLLDSNRVIAMYQAEKDSEKKVQSRFKGNC